MKKYFISSAIVLSMEIGFMLSSVYAMDCSSAGREENYQGQKKIEFCGWGGPFWEFTNTFMAPIGRNPVFPSADHYFQGRKFTGSPLIQEEVSQSNTPFETACTNLGNIDGHWFGVREHEMSETLRLKFQAHPQLAALLLATDGFSLHYVYNYQRDSQEEDQVVNKLATLRKEFLSGEFYPSIMQEQVQIQITEKTKAAVEKLGLTDKFKGYLKQILIQAGQSYADAPEGKEAERF